MDPNDMVPFKVLIIDDQTGPSSFGQLTKKKLDKLEFATVHVTSWTEAKARLQDGQFDMFMVDLSLQTPPDGISIVAELRSMGFDDPVILVTGNQDYLDRAVREYGNVFSLGSVSFYDKLEGDTIVQVAREVSSRVDSLRRALRIMQTAGLGSRKIDLVGGGAFTVDQILASKNAKDSLARGLRDGLNVLLVELATELQKRGGQEK